MPQAAFFDTAPIHYIGTALQNTALSLEAREKIVVSPLSAFEVLSHLCVTRSDEVLREIQAMHKWIDPRGAGLLPWPDDAVATIGFGKRVIDDAFTQRMQTAFNVCLNAESAGSLLEEACKLKDVMDTIKVKTAEDFGRMLEAARTESPKTDWFSEPWFKGIVKRAGAEPGSRSKVEVENAFSAYREFERVKLERALRAKDYNPEKRRNDLIDAEQLIYLGDPALCFITCDKGFASVSSSAQAARIIIVPPADLADPHRIEALLRNLPH
jgi:hypothetical protein